MYQKPRMQAAISEWIFSLQATGQSENELNIAGCQSVDNCPILYFTPGSGHSAPPDDYSLHLSCAGASPNPNPNPVVIDLNICTITPDTPAPGVFEIFCCFGSGGADEFMNSCFNNGGDNAAIQIVHDADGHSRQISFDPDCQSS